MGKYFEKEVDYDAYLLEGSDEKPEIETCPICEFDFDDCEHDEDDIQEWNDEDEGQYLAEKEIEEMEEEDLNAEVDW